MRFSNDDKKTTMTIHESTKRSLCSCKLHPRVGNEEMILILVDFYNAHKGLESDLRRKADDLGKTCESSIEKEVPVSLPSEPENGSAQDIIKEF